MTKDTLAGVPVDKGAFRSMYQQYVPTISG